MNKFNYNVVEFSELYAAYKDCLKHKKNSLNAKEFNIDLAKKLYTLLDELNTMEYKVSDSIAFCVLKPKRREVFAANFRDRIVQHLFINRIIDLIEGELIDDSYSCRKGKGVLYGVDRCREKIEESTKHYTKEKVLCKCDLTSFFVTISKQRVYDKVINLIKEKYTPKSEYDMVFMDFLLKTILFDEPQKHCIIKQPKSYWGNLVELGKSLFACKKGYGLPIGNLDSQIFANFFMDEFDKFVTIDLGIKYYGRYVDDFYFICDKKEGVNKYLSLMEDKLKDMEISLNHKKTVITRASIGFEFIGTIIKPYRQYATKRTKGNFYDKLHRYAEYIRSVGYENVTDNEAKYMVNSLNSYFGYLVHQNTFNLRKKMMLSDDMKEILHFAGYTYKYNKLVLDYRIKNRNISKCIESVMH